MYHMGLLLCDRKRDTEGAVRYWEALAELDPTHVNCHRRLGRLFAQEVRADVGRMDLLAWR